MGTITTAPAFTNIVADDATYTGIVTVDANVLKYRTKAQILVDIGAAPDNLGNHTATEILKMGAHAVVGTDQQHRLFMDPVADEVHLYPGDEAADAHIIFKSTGVSSDSNPIIMPPVNEDGTLGINTQRWYNIHTRNISISGKAVGAIHDEDNMVSNSNVSLATQQSIKAYVDGLAIVGKATEVFYGNGAFMSGGYAHPFIAMPANDNDCYIKAAFHIPDNWTTGGLVCRIRYLNSGSAAYSVVVDAECYQTGATYLVGAPNYGRNLLSLSNAYDFPAGTANRLYFKTITLADADIVPGGTFGISFISDALNAGILYITEIFITRS